ncbi:MAG: ATP-binding protein [Anaeromyxobacteraceae bacterium]
MDGGAARGAARREDAAARVRGARAAGVAGHEEAPTRSIDRSGGASAAPERPRLLLATLERILAIDASTVDAALQEAADLVTRAARADKVDVFLYDASCDTLVAKGTSRTSMGERQKRAGLDRLPLANGGRAAHVYRSREPFLTGDSAHDPGELRAISAALGVRSTVLAPLEIGGDVRGVLGVASAEVDRYDAQDLAFVIAVGRWIGLLAHRAELNEHLAASAREAGRREAAEELVTVVAHDLRNALGRVLGRVQLLLRRAEREGRPADERDARAAEGAVRGAAQLIGDLLDVARLDQGLFELTPVPLDLVATAREVAESLAVPGHEVLVRGPDELVLSADAARVRQILANLIANAVKHARPGTAVDVDVRRAEEAAAAFGEVEVTNSGAAIPPELADHLFDRFARGPGSSGLGLGLYLAQRMAAAHGGTIDVSTAERRVRFRVRLPVR